MLIIGTWIILDLGHLYYHKLSLVIILKKSVMVHLVTPVVAGCNNRCGLILEEMLIEQLLCQNNNRRSSDVSVYSAATQTNFVLIKKSVNNWNFAWEWWTNNTYNKNY